VRRFKRGGLNEFTALEHAIAELEAHPTRKVTDAGTDPPGGRLCVGSTPDNGIPAGTIFT
jgi:hypothetical protein